MPATLILLSASRLLAYTERLESIGSVVGKSSGMAGRYCPIRQCMVLLAGSAVLSLVLTGCELGQLPHGEQYEVSSLRIVFLDASQIQAKYEEITGKSSVMMTPRLALETRRREEVVVGFYDFRTHTIYCPKMDFEVCGHELHHAVLGHFHLHR